MVWYIEESRKTMEKRKILLEKLEEYIEKYQNHYEIKLVESNKIIHKNVNAVKRG